MNQNVPFVWRKNYQNEVGSNEELLETAHEKARQYLSRRRSCDEIEQIAP